VGSWFDFTRTVPVSLSDVLTDLRSLSSAHLSVDDLLPAFRLLYDARGIFDACEYDFFSTAGFSRDPQMRTAFEVFDAARAKVSDRLYDPVVHAEIRRRLHADAAASALPPPAGVRDAGRVDDRVDDHEVVWCTIAAHLAGPLGPLLVPHLEFAQITTRRPQTWARSACLPASYVPSGLLVATPLWLYRYTASLEHDPAPTLSPPVDLSGPARDYLGGLWTGDARDFDRLLEVSCRLARIPAPLRYSSTRKR
jgi:hypothetical protein